ncbi:MAG: lamin tail domain-containing protein [Verrucomicrobiota bacterium]|nr:lamin tail domain-containing protein [Verrucomicrobiota bacterium]
MEIDSNRLRPVGVFPKYLLSGAFFLLSVICFAQVVINEVHFNPADNTQRVEFIELTNLGQTTVDLAGWAFDDGISFTFPVGIRIEPGGYRVVAEDPLTIRSIFGIEALGPWDGGLKSEGERLRLRNHLGEVVDELRYGVGFPWPVASSGEGGSMELANPNLDNSLGSSWRAAPPDSLPSPDRYRWVISGDPCLVLVPVGAWDDATWREPDFDASGWVSGQTGVGFERTAADYRELIRTDLSAEMDYGSPSFYVRIPFEINQLPALTGLTLRMKFDDGFIGYLNGVEVASVNAPANPAWDSEATGQNSDAQAVKFRDFDLSWAKSLLRTGRNVLAIHGLNDSPSSSDALVLPELEGVYAPLPVLLGATPGARNRMYVENPPPAIEQVRPMPAQPRSLEPTVIEAHIRDGDGVATARLEYQAVEPGRYIPSHLPVPLDQLQQNPEREPALNPAYSAQVNWVSLSMQDSGRDGDRVAGDGVFSVTVPGQGNRVLVRYRVVAEDGRGASVRAPFADDPSLNFAYFVYDGVPAYGNYGNEVMEALPVYSLIARAADVTQVVAYSTGDQIPQFLGSASNEARYAFNWCGTLVYDGVVYDNIRFRLRGANGRYQLGGKRNWRFKFNKGHYLRAKDQYGNPFPSEWRALNTGKGLSNRGTLTYSLNEAVNNFLFNRIGVPAPEAFYFHFRVIDGQDEEPDPYHGDFWGLSWAQENYDSDFLESHGLSKGNLYKLINSKREGLDQQRYQAPYAVADGSDHDNIEANATGYQSLDWLRAHIHYEEWYLYRGLSEAIKHYDYWPDSNKNAAWYFEPVYTPENGFWGRMWTLPWDTDSTWGPTWNEGHDVVYNTVFRSDAGGGDSGEHPELQVEYKNVLRELRDLLWQEDQIFPVIDHLAAPLHDFIPSDRRRWYLAPADAGNYSGLTGPGLASFASYVQDMKNFAFSGGAWPGGNVPTGGQAAVIDQVAADTRIPSTPDLTYIGEPGYPISGLLFRSSGFTDPQGAGTFGAMEYRVAEVEPEPYQALVAGRPPILEWDAVWASGRIETFQPEILLPPNQLKPGRVYRARVRHSDETGRWSHWSAPVEFMPSAPDLEVYRDQLWITEIMYHPAPITPDEVTAGYEEGDFEFLEFYNAGTTSLDLRPLHFTEGISFQFQQAAVAALNPGQRAVLVSNTAAFRMRYGNSITILGEYGIGPDATSLSNSGEQLTIVYGLNDPILSFSYSDAPPWPTAADGEGYSLVLSRPWALPNPSDVASWRLSSTLHGNPGGHDHQLYGQWAIERGGVEDPLADADGDNQVNAVEYALDTDPHDPSDSQQPALAVMDLVVGGQRRPYFTLSLRRPVNHDDCDLVAFAADTPTGFLTGQAPLPLAGPPVLNGDGTETLIWRDEFPMDLKGRNQRFFRFHVILLP